MPYASLGRGKSRKTRSIPRGKLSLRAASSHMATNRCSYVEMLEQQQSQLVAGLRELYTRLQKGQSWPGAPLRNAQGGHPLTHDILERLDLLHPSNDSGSNYDGFEEDCNRMQQKLLEEGAPFTRRRASVSSESEHDHTSSNSSYGGTPTTKTVPLSDPFARHNAPPTPPMHSPFPRQSQIVAPIKQEAAIMPNGFMNTGALDPTALSRTNWQSDGMMMDEPLDFGKSVYGFETYGNMDQNTMMLDPIVVNDPAMPDWNTPNDLDFSSFIHNQAGA